MAKGFSMKMTGGRPRTGSSLSQWASTHVDPALRAAGLTLQGVLQKNTPVVRGTLRRGWNTSRPESAGTIRRVLVSNPVIYARRVDRVSKANKGYIGRGIGAGLPGAVQAFRNAMKGSAGDLWDRGAK